MSTYEDDLRAALKVEFDVGELRVLGKSDELFDALEQFYPAYGSKIDWRRIPRSIQGIDADFADFFLEQCLRFKLTGPVIYIGDSATGFALEGSIEAIQTVLPTLTQIPQHHYFIGPHFSWCLCLTMEGDMDFGFTPNGGLH